MDQISFTLLLDYWKARIIKLQQMSVEHLMIDFLITAQSITPYEAYAIEDKLYRNTSLEKESSATTIKDRRLQTLNQGSSVERAAEMEELRANLIILSQTSGLTKMQREVFDLALANLGTTEIARELNYPGRQYAQNILARALKKIRLNPSSSELLVEYI